MKARSEYAEDNGVKRGSCRHAMLIQPPQPIQLTKKPPASKIIQVGVLCQRRWINISLFRLGILLCREHSASHCCFIQIFMPCPWLLSLMALQSPLCQAELCH